MIAKRLMARQYRFAVNHASGYTHHARPGIPRQIRFGYSRTGPYAQTLDPYGVMDEWELPEEFDQIGREHFARAPGSDICVWFGDLPEETRAKLAHKEKPSFTILGGEVISNIDV